MPSHAKPKKHHTGVVVLGVMGHLKQKWCPLFHRPFPPSRFQLLHDACLRKEAEEQGVPKNFKHEFFRLAHEEFQVLNT